MHWSFDLANINDAHFFTERRAVMYASTVSLSDRARRPIQLAKDSKPAKTSPTTKTENELRPVYRMLDTWTYIQLRFHTPIPEREVRDYLWWSTSYVRAGRQDEAEER